MTAASIAIIGLGPRGLSVLERIVTFARVRCIPVQLHLLDPREHGQGSHSTRQSDHLLINSVASQITMFTDDTVKLLGMPNPGPSLAEWARMAGIRRFRSRYFQIGDDGFGEPIDDNDYVPRAMLGDYLSWVHDEIVRRAGEGTQVRQYKSAATDVQIDGSGFTIRLTSGFPIRADFLFLTTGHAQNDPDDDDRRFLSFVDQYARLNPALGYFRSTYPIQQFDAVPPSATVAVQGMGLTAHDVISELTVGRRGRFSVSDSGFKYHPSGTEPRILLYSRQGLPFTARGNNQKGAHGLYVPRFFTEAWARSLRDAGRKLDFHTDIYPTLFKEMAYAYRSAIDGGTTAPSEFRVSVQEAAAIRKILHPLQGLVFRDQSQFRKFVRIYVADDLAHAKQGNVADPVKSATDFLRDARDVLRYLIEWEGLTGESHRSFNQSFAPIVNRVAVGPPIVRNEQLLALMSAGVVEIGGGPLPEVELVPDRGQYVVRSRFLEEHSHDVADVIVRARIDPPVPELDASPLMRNLLAKGYVKPFQNDEYKAGGIDIDRCNHPRDAWGSVIRAMWALGSIVEGANYFTYVLPRPNVNSRFLRDADRCVADLFNQIAARASHRELNRKRGASLTCRT
jgi:uncharacterized NAD(P)/FAD-binding protein YdhS